MSCCSSCCCTFKLLLLLLLFLLLLLLRDFTPKHCTSDAIEECPFKYAKQASGFRLNTRNASARCVSFASHSHPFFDVRTDASIVQNTLHGVSL